LDKGDRNRHNTTASVRFRLAEDDFAACQLKDDDAAYLDWISAHSGGFVLNADRNPNAAFVVLHLAGCSSISGLPANGRSWTADYLKVCSDDRLSIERWCQQQVGTNPSSCGRCHP
jgi:hypothetical protein